MRILFIDTAHPLLKKLLSDAGHECTDGSMLPREDILKRIKDFEGVIIRSRTNVDREFIDRAPALKFIGRVGAGMESIDVAYAESKNISCLNSPEGNRDAVAEHALGMLLALLNNIHRADRQVREGKWIREANRGTELSGKTIGIIGYGNTGSAFAQRLSVFGMNLLVYDKYKKGFGNSSVKESSLEELFSRCDVVSLHIPLSKETAYWVNDGFLGRFKKDIYLINTSRGKIVRTADLVKNLKSGKVRGACLDVNEYEETSFETLSDSQKKKDLDTEAWSYLIRSDKVILTPHIAGWSYESNEKLARVLAEKIIKKFGG